MGNRCRQEVVIFDKRGPLGDKWELNTNGNIAEDLVCTVKHQADDMGQVWIGRKSVYRRIFPQSQEASLAFLWSDLFKELFAKNLFPQTQIKEGSRQAGKVVLEHERAPFIMGAWEWSFSMLKQAALMMIEVSDICKKHGYYLQDSHHFNVVFFGGHPKFVDFGSFRKGRPLNSLNINEFLEAFYLPLAVWAHGDFYIVNQILNDDRQGKRLQPFGGLASSPLMHRYLLNFIRKRDLAWYVKRSLNVIMKIIPRSERFSFDLSGYGSVGITDNTVLRKSIEALMPPDSQTEWAKYYDGRVMDGEVPLRFTRILDILGRYQWATAVDIAGNGGFFSELMARRFREARILCLDYDSQAVEKCYQRFRDNVDLSVRITSGLVNIMYPVDRNISFTKRASADLGLALALTHHLLLGQGANIDVVLKDLLGLVHKYLLVEFMPLGLWDGKSAPPLPEWYTREWFKEHLLMHADIIHEEQTEENRIFYLCLKR